MTKVGRTSMEGWFVRITGSIDSKVVEVSTGALL